MYAGVTHCLESTPAGDFLAQAAPIIAAVQNVLSDFRNKSFMNCLPLFFLSHPNSGTNTVIYYLYCILF